MNSLTVFAFETQSVRFVDGLPVANDIAAVLGYSDPAKTISTKVDQDYKCVTALVTVDGKLRDVIVLKEPGIYQLIFSSKLKSAERFRKWIFEEVLPSIRKTGSYGKRDRLSFGEKIDKIGSLPEKSQVAFIKSEEHIAIQKEKTKQEYLRYKQVEAKISLTNLLYEKKTQRFDRIIQKQLNQRDKLKKAILDKMRKQNLASITSRQVIQCFRRYRINNAEICTETVLDVFAEMQTEGLGTLIEKRFILGETPSKAFDQLPISCTH